MQGHRAGLRNGNRFKSRRCRALCCTSSSRVSVSSEGESFGSDHYAPMVSSIGHYMVQERLAQMIKEREHKDEQQQSRCGSSRSLVRGDPDVCSLSPDKQMCKFYKTENQEREPRYRSKIRGNKDVSSFTPDKQKGYPRQEEDRARKLVEAGKGKQKRVVKNGATITSSSRNSSRRLVMIVAVEKSSDDPRGDFRQSMVEVILANQIEQPKDLRDLLNCYLSMNSKEYEGVILEVFHQVCSDLFV